MNKVVAPDVAGLGVARVHPHVPDTASVDDRDDGGADDAGPDRQGADRQGADREGVEVGAVFLARNRQERRVWAVRDGRVHFFAKPPGGGTFWSPGHPPHLAPTIELFLAEAAGRLISGLGRKSPAPERTQRPDRPIPPHKNAYR